MHRKSRPSATIIFGSLIALSAVYLIAKKYQFSEEIYELERCSRYPELTDIFYDNIYWQVLKIPSGFVKIFNAYLDDRRNQNIVKINVLSFLINITTDTIYCQFWYDEVSEPVVIKATEYQMMWTNTWRIVPNESQPYLITCPIYHDDFSKGLPISVSLAAAPCENATNNMMIINNQPTNGTKAKFGVCSKATHYSDRNYISRIIEWIHLLKILGAAKIYIYNEYVHPDIFDVLEYFQEKNYIEVYPFIQPSGIPDNVKHHGQEVLLQMTVLNDCFYRTRNLYEYIAVLDTDEVIIPVKANERTWFDLMVRYAHETHDGFIADNFYYPDIEAAVIDGIPKYMYMLQHVQGSSNYTKLPYKIQYKSFQKPDNIVVVHNHSPLICFDGILNCRNVTFPLDIAQLSHYRDHIDENVTINLKNDTTIWKYKNDLIDRVKETLLVLGIIP